MEWIILLAVIVVVYLYYKKNQINRQQIEHIESFPEKIYEKFKSTIAEIQDSIKQHEESKINLGDITKKIMQRYNDDLEDTQNLMQKFYYIVEKYKHYDPYKKVPIYQDFWEYLVTLQSDYQKTKYGLSDFDLSEEERMAKTMSMKALRDRIETY